MKNTLGILVGLALLAALAACARQGYPSGGPKDETPPVALGAHPQNESRHFDSRQFYIEFDEYVVLKNASDNVIVSPPLKNKPEYTTKGKGVVVKLNDTLQPNTTYLFQFKEAIADFNEGNLLPSFEYVFSTGEAMDTLMLAGQVIDARSGKPWKEMVTVMAYRTADGGRESENDTLATTMQPDYVTRCDKEGNFAFHYIPEGRYRLVALEDKNRNLRLDTDDPAAWDTASHAATASIDSNAMPTLRLSAPTLRKQRVTASEFTSKGHIRIVTAAPMLQPRLTTDEAVEWRLNSRGDTMMVWCLNAMCDSAVIVVSDTDLQDTLRLRHRAKPQGKGARRGPGIGSTTTEEPLMKTHFSGGGAYYDRLRLTFTNPIVSTADSAMVQVTHSKDSTTTLCPIILDSTGLSATIVATLKSGESYKVYIPKGLFTDIYGTSTDSLTEMVSPKDYATLTLHITNTFASPLVIEVLDNRDTVVQRQPLAASGTVKFTHLGAGEHRVRAVIDTDGNGQWTPGDYRQQRPPEASVMYSKTLQLREKWEIEELWTVKEELSAKAAPKVIPTRLDGLGGTTPFNRKN